MGHSVARPADFVAPDAGLPGARAPFDAIAKARARAAPGSPTSPPRWVGSSAEALSRLATSPKRSPGRMLSPTTRALSSSLQRRPPPPALRRDARLLSARALPFAAPTSRTIPHRLTLLAKTDHPTPLPQR